MPAAARTSSCGPSSSSRKTDGGPPFGITTVPQAAACRVRGASSSSQEVRDPVRPGLDAVLLQQERDLAAMTGAMRRDVQQHLAARHARGLAVREGEGDHLVHLFGPQRIGIVGIPVGRRCGPCSPAPRRRGVRSSGAPDGRAAHASRLRLKISSTVWMWSSSRRTRICFVGGQALEIVGDDRIKAVGRPALLLHQGAIGEGEHRSAFHP